MSGVDMGKYAYGTEANTWNFGLRLLWPPYGIGQAIIFSSSSSFCLFSSPILSYRRLDVYHTSTHGVALMQI